MKFTSLFICYLCFLAVVVFRLSRPPRWMQWEPIWEVPPPCVRPLSQQLHSGYQSILSVKFSQYRLSNITTDYKWIGFSDCWRLPDFWSLNLLIFLGLAPLCENMPSGKATKPGDVVTAKNGKTIQVGGHTKVFKLLHCCHKQVSGTLVCRLTTRMQRADSSLLTHYVMDTLSIPEPLSTLLH